MIIIFLYYANAVVANEIYILYYFMIISIGHLHKLNRNNRIRYYIRLHHFI